jgi:hypothetical protein
MAMAAYLCLVGAALKEKDVLLNLYNKFAAAITIAVILCGCASHAPDLPSITRQTTDTAVPATRAAEATGGYDVAMPQPETGGQAQTDSPAMLWARRIAKERTCSKKPEVKLVGKGAGYEVYSAACTNGDTLMIRCEVGSCRALQ